MNEKINKVRISFPLNLGILEERCRSESLSRAGLTACQDKQQAGTRMSWLIAVLSLFIFFERNTSQHLTYSKLVGTDSLPSYCTCTKTFFFLMSRFEEKVCVFCELTRLRRRLMAYSWVQTHSHGSKPPSAILSHPVRPWRSTTKRLNALRHFVGETEH